MLLAWNIGFKKFGVRESFHICHEDQELKLLFYNTIKLMYDENHYKQASEMWLKNI